MFITNLSRLKYLLYTRKPPTVDIPPNANTLSASTGAGTSFVWDLRVVMKSGSFFWGFLSPSHGIRGIYLLPALNEFKVRMFTTRIDAEEIGPVHFVSNYYCQFSRSSPLSTVAYAKLVLIKNSVNWLVQITFVRRPRRHRHQQTSWSRVPNSTYYRCTSD